MYPIKSLFWWIGNVSQGGVRKIPYENLSIGKDTNIWETSNFFFNNKYFLQSPLNLNKLRIIHK